MVNKKLNKMKKAVIDQILLWLILFISFVTLLFMILDYSAIVRLKGNTDILAQYGSRMVSLGNTDAEVADKLNAIKISYFNTIAASDIVCTTSTATTANEYQVVFNVTSTYNEAKVLKFNNTIYSNVATFNEQSSEYISCSLALTKK